MHIPKDGRLKVGDNSKEYIFLSSRHEEFRYKLWDPVAKKLIKSTDVVFLEDYIVYD